ncbi:hypothetical protein KUCAC02_024860 [Chaenocephalus aceratus]|nr:hypothetical protein KUCAC02_024860 [Chaenocephalus aceratus]
MTFQYPMGNCTTYAGGHFFLQSASWCQPKISEESHDGHIGGHFGREKTHEAIIQRYHWPGTEEDIRKWVTEPLELVGMDPVGNSQ